MALGLALGEIEIDILSREVRTGNSVIHLSGIEQSLLYLLASRGGHVVSRDEILHKIWGLEAQPSNRTVDNFIVKLRRKVEKAADKPAHILTVYGFGYKLVM